MFEVHIYIETDSASPKDTEKQYGYVLECRMASGKIETRQGFGKLEGTYHQITLSALSEAMKRIHKSCEITVHTENIFVANMLNQNMERWAGNGFLTSKGKPIANQDKWRDIWDSYKKHIVKTESGSHAYSSWLQMEMRKR